VDQVIFVMQVGRNRHEDIMESLELFATEVMPEFAERDEAARKAKAERFAPIIEAAFARKAATEPALPAMPEGYALKAYPKAMADKAGDEQGQEFMDRLADHQAAGIPDESLKGTMLGGF
jgi:hypothetical protein